MTLRLRGILPLGVRSLAPRRVAAGDQVCALRASGTAAVAGLRTAAEVQAPSPEMFTIHETPNGSVHIPKLSPQGARSSGSVTVPLADSASK